MKKIDQQKLFIIIAPDRSGTSLIQLLMNTFKGFCNTEESRISGPDSPSCWEYVIKMNDFSYLEKFINEKWTSEFFVEKSPPSINCMPQISEKFPDANFIFLKRNPLKIILSQLNLFYGVSEIGKRKYDLGELILNKGTTLFSLERIMTKRLLKMIRDQMRFKSLFRNSIEIKYEDFINSLDSKIKLLEKKFDIKADYKKAHSVIDTPSYSSTFRYGLTELDDKVSKDIIKLGCKIWGYL